MVAPESPKFSISALPLSDGRWMAIPEDLPGFDDCEVTEDDLESAVRACQELVRERLERGHVDAPASQDR